MPQTRLTSHHLLVHLYESRIFDPVDISGFLGQFGKTPGDVDRAKEILCDLVEQGFIRVKPNDGQKHLGTIATEFEGKVQLISFDDLRIAISKAGEEEVVRRRGRGWAVPPWLEWFAKMTDRTKGIVVAMVAITGFFGWKMVEKESQPSEGLVINIILTAPNGEPFAQQAHLLFKGSDTSFARTVVSARDTLRLDHPLKDVWMSASSAGFVTWAKFFPVLDSTIRSIDCNFEELPDPGVQPLESLPPTIQGAEGAETESG